MLKALTKTFTKKRKFSLLFLGTAVLIALLAGGTFLAIYPQQTVYTFQVLDNQGNLVPGVSLFWFDSSADPYYNYRPTTYYWVPPTPTDTWIYFGDTDAYGYYLTVAYDGMQFKAVYNNFVGYGVTSNGGCVISLPTYIGKTALDVPSPTTAPLSASEPKYLFTFKQRGLGDGLEWSVSVDNGNKVASVSDVVDLYATSGQHTYMLNAPAGYVADYPSGVFGVPKENGGVYIVSFSAAANAESTVSPMPEATPAPDDLSSVLTTTSGVPISPPSFWSDPFGAIWYWLTHLI